MRLPEVLEITGLSRTTIWRREQDICGWGARGELGSVGRPVNERGGVV
ncbi:MAG: hypothetical protein OXI84_00025 [bacterium]|nr:hypothetical protein [bacterium]